MQRAEHSCRVTCGRIAVLEVKYYLASLDLYTLYGVHTEQLRCYSKTGKYY